MKKKSLFLLALIPSCLMSLEEKPWYSDVGEFNFRTTYEYSFFNEIDNAVPRLNVNYWTHLGAWGLELTPLPTWNGEIELEFAETRNVSWGYRSFAVQVRKLWLDDVCGDPISLSTGISYRDASSKLREAFSTPYHARANFEFHLSLGKEWSCGPYWYFRTFATGAVGQGTQGSPWLRGDLYFWWNICDCHQFRLFTQSYWGLGSERTVFIDEFDGWGDIGHQNIDIGASYRIFLGVWGNLRFDYLYRVYARSYPESAHFFLATYKLPFCPF